MTGICNMPMGDEKYNIAPDLGDLGLDDRIILK
jgi:hypothetical protein